jgi:glycosyltransferase involved in cell wall biosynthesis
MRVTLDARWIFREMSGVGVYTQELIRRLPRVGARHTWRLLFCDAGLRDRTVRAAGAGDLPNVETELVPCGVFSLRGQIEVPRRLRSTPPDVYHSTNFMIPYRAFPRARRRGARCVVTIHDVIPLVVPDHAPRSRKSRLMPLFRLLMREVGRRADAILTVSEASKRDICGTLGVPSERVHAIYNGVSLPVLPREPVARASRPAPDARRTVLYVGRADPYKNLVGLVRAFAALRERVAFPVRLKVVGAEDPRYPEPREWVRRLGLDGVVEWVGYVEPAGLVACYREADLLVHPSRYEGFGLQVIEAMASGLPVVCSRAASLPEVAGDAAVLVDPDDIEGFAGAMASVLTDPDRADAMRRAGMRRAAGFTWDRAAEATLAVYERLAAEAGTGGGRA